MDQKPYFTIGEISGLYNIPVKTLRYYDSVGLFKPEKVNPDNSCRYYSIEQFEMLNSIKYLRHMGLSIKDIKKHIKTKDSGSFINHDFFTLTPYIPVMNNATNNF